MTDTMSCSTPDYTEDVIMISVCLCQCPKLVLIFASLISLVCEQKHVSTAVSTIKMQCRINQRTVIKFMVAQDKSPIQCW